jgi:hypothetical protein
LIDEETLDSKGKVLEMFWLILDENELTFSCSELLFFRSASDDKREGVPKKKESSDVSEVSDVSIWLRVVVCEKLSVGMDFSLPKDNSKTVTVVNTKSRAEIICPHFLVGLILAAAFFGVSGLIQYTQKRSLSLTSALQKGHFFIDAAPMFF